MSFSNNRGQGLVEYLIIVALMGVATIVTVKLLQKTVNINMSRIVQSLQGKKAKVELKHEEIRQSHIEKKDFSDFMHGTVNRESKGDKNE